MQKCAARKPQMVIVVKPIGCSPFQRDQAQDSTAIRAYHGASEGNFWVAPFFSGGMMSKELGR